MKMTFAERIMLPERFRIPYFGGVWYRFLTRQTRKKIKSVPIESLSLNREKRDVKLVFTLTTFPDRIDTVQYTLRSLYMQTLKPDRVILWLAESEFSGKSLPNSILEFEKVGLEIRYCDNLFGHKRYYQLLAEQREDECIVMFDDDILFQPKVVERLYQVWKNNPGCIVCERGQELTFEKDGSVMNPGRWSTNSSVGIKKPSYRLLASPGGGCLVPPHALYKDADNPELIKKYALKTGDIWLMFMAAQNDTKILKTYKNHRTFILSEDMQTVQLGKEAIYGGRYMKTFKELSQAYPHAYKNMLSEIEC